MRAAQGYVFTKQSDSPWKRQLRRPEPILIPRLRIQLAEFPYLRCPWPWAARPGDLLRIGTGVCVCARCFTGGQSWCTATPPPHGVCCFVLQVSAGAPLCGGGGPPAPALRPPAHGALPRATRRGNACPPACRLRAIAPLGPGSPSAERPGGRTRLPALGALARVCYCHQDLHRGRLHACARTRFCGACAPSYHAVRARGRGGAAAPSIFGAGLFGRYVATRFLAAADFYGHRPAVPTCPRPCVSVRRWGPLPAHEVVPSLPALLTRDGPLGARSPARARCCARPAASQFGGAPTFRRTPRHCSTRQTCRAPAVLRDISEGTSYQAVRLVFRPYAQVLPSNCTSERLGASTRVSAGFARPRRSSLPIGSHVRSSFSAACWPSLRLGAPRTRCAHALLGPCFKTGPTSWLPPR